MSYCCFFFFFLSALNVFFMSSKYSRIRTKSAFILKIIRAIPSIYLDYIVYILRNFTLYTIIKNNPKKLCLEANVWWKEKSFSRRNTCFNLVVDTKEIYAKTHLVSRGSTYWCLLVLKIEFKRTLAIFVIEICNELPIIYFRAYKVQIDIFVYLS